MLERRHLPYLAFGVSAVLAVSAAVMFVRQSGKLREATQRQSEAMDEAEAGESIPSKPVQEPVAPGEMPKSSADELAHLGLGARATSPEQLASLAAKAIEAGDISALERLLGQQALDPDVASQLKALIATRPKLKQPGGIREVGELELNRKTRWAIELSDREPGKDRILLDMERKDGAWSIQSVVIPSAGGQAPPKAMVADSLGVADAFLQAVLKQDFDFARDFVDSRSVSDIKIAALCILFEEGNYRMRVAKPLRKMFERDGTVGFMGHVVSDDETDTARFSMALRQPVPTSHWIVTELNLDQLIADYADRVADGDVYYSPLVRNPAGGETIALYFDFDVAEMDPRTQRQLEIVAMILKADATKKITLSGHTDSLGSEDYNRSLSSKRADVVRKRLIDAGVSAEQIVTVAKGASQPRRPNVTETGTDDPGGRRANRRTEIYLDF
jgi:outer membrane protein OmpA-like peptidoglycan-associated protein